MCIQSKSSREPDRGDAERAAASDSKVADSNKLHVKQHDAMWCTLALIRVPSGASCLLTKRSGEVCMCVWQLVCNIWKMLLPEITCQEPNL